MKRKSMSINIILNGIRSVLSLLFPLITFPYITRILSPEGVGQANYASSVANYFILIGGLGIGAYAIREGAKRSEEKEKFESFADEIWTISILASVFAYICLFFLLTFSAKLNLYRWLVGFYSLQILSNALGMEWVLNVYEEYEYVTIRSFVFQVISLLLLFLLVRKPTDVYLYVMVQMISIMGIGLANHIYVRRKVKLKFIWSKDLIRHMPPIMLIFLQRLRPLFM